MIGEFNTLLVVVLLITIDTLVDLFDPRLVRFRQKAENWQNRSEIQAPQHGRHDRANERRDQTKAIWPGKSKTLNKTAHPCLGASYPRGQRGSIVVIDFPILEQGGLERYIVR